MSPLCALLCALHLPLWCSRLLFVCCCFLPNITPKRGSSMARCSARLYIYLLAGIRWLYTQFFRDVCVYSRQVVSYKPCVTFGRWSLATSFCLFGLVFIYLSSFAPYNRLLAVFGVYSWGPCLFAVRRLGYNNNLLL